MSETATTTEAPELTQARAAMMEARANLRDAQQIHKDATRALSELEIAARKRRESGN